MAATRCTRLPKPAKGKLQESTTGDHNYNHFEVAGKQLIVERQDMNHANRIYSVDLKKAKQPSLLM